MFIEASGGRVRWIVADLYCGGLLSSLTGTTFQQFCFSGPVFFENWKEEVEVLLP